MIAKTMAALEEELDNLHSSLARMASSDSSNRSAARRNHEARRRLENAVRKHSTGQCDCDNAKQCLLIIGRLVPINPRPKYGKSRVKVTR